MRKKLILILLFGLSSYTLIAQYEALENSTNQTIQQRYTSAKNFLSGSSPSAENFGRAIDLLEDAKVAIPAPTVQEGKALDAYINETLTKWIAWSDKQYRATQNALNQARIDRARADSLKEIALNEKKIAEENGQRAEAQRLGLLSNGRLANNLADEALVSAYMALTLTAYDSIDTEMWRRLGESALQLPQDKSQVFPDTISQFFMDKKKTKILVSLKNKSVYSLNIAQTENEERGAPQLVFPANENLKLVRLSPNGKYAALAIDTIVQVYDLDKGSLHHSYKHNGRIYDLKFSQGSNYLASASRDKQIGLLNLSKGKKELKRLQGHENKVYQLAFSEKAGLLISRGGDYKILLWNLKGELLNELEAQQLYTKDIQLSSSGASFVTIGSLGELELWDPIAQSLKATLANEAQPINDIFFFGQDAYLVSLDQTGNTKVWDLSTLKEQVPSQSLIAASGNLVDNSKEAYFSQSNGSFQLMQENGNISDPITGHLNPVFAIDFLEDKSYYLSAALDNTAKLWNNKGEVLLNIRIDPINPLPAFFAPHGKGLYYFSPGNRSLNYADMPKNLYQKLLDGKIKDYEEVVKRLIVKEKLTFFKSN